MRLCLEMGVPSVSELLHRVTSAEITEWMAFETINGPLGGRRADYNTALITKTLIDVNAGKKRRKRKLTDFVLKWGKRTRPKDDREMRAKVMSVFGFSDDEGR